MNIEVVELIEKANKIISATGSGAGVKYPKSLKQIVVTLRLDHNISIQELIKHIPISKYSAREWPKQSIQNPPFNKVIVKKDPSKVLRKENTKRNNKLEKIMFNQKVLIVLTILLIFESLASRLFF